MILIHIFALSGSILFLLCFRGMSCKVGPISGRLPAAVFFAALGVRLFCAALSMGFGNDTACFAGWADRIFLLGPGGFYSPEAFTDYPPGYLYVLWPLGAVRNLLGIEMYSMAHLVLLKLPSILCDLACGRLLYREASRKCTQMQALFLCAAYLFNPPVILNSSVWGQVDSVFTLAAVILCLSLVRGKMYPAYIAFGTGVLIKPQMLLFSPVLLAGLLDHILPKREAASSGALRTGLKILFKNLLQILSVAAGMCLLCLPFGLETVWNQYFTTVASYPYAAVNASNFWGMLGLNWISQNNTFLGVPYYVFGWTAIAAAVCFVLFLSLRNRGSREKFPFLAAVLILSIYMFSVRMHERYLYPALVLLLLAYTYKPARQLYLAYSGFSLLHFYNAADVLFFYDPADYDRKAPIILLVSAGMLLCTIYLYFVSWRLYFRDNSGWIAWDTISDTASHLTCGYRNWVKGAPPKASRPGAPLRAADILCMLLLTLLYAGFALYDLGERSAPVTAYEMTDAQSVELDFGGEIPASLSYYIAPWQDRHFALTEQSESSGEWIPLGEITLERVFTWKEIPLEADTPRIRLTLRDNQASLLELVFRNRAGERITPLNAGDYPALFDEGSLYSGQSSFRNSMYFDEIYHGRTAYEFLHGLTSYENTHPPMGKILIALGVAVFGMNPFGWRIVGTVLGILMVPIVYLFARRLTRDTLSAALACLLFAFDFMHFTQTRLATIDVYITFFVLLMYYFMYQYSVLSFYDTSLRKTWLPLGACGICMGMGVACKWTGVYAGCGLAVIFFSVLYRRYREYLYAKSDPEGATEGISHRHILASFLPNTRRTVYFCLVFFVVLPALIYLLSYLPFRDYSGRGLLARALYNQSTMYGYHSNLDATHAFSSPWYEWPVMMRPIWYYSRIVTGAAEQGGLREGISAFGNPAVWWVGIPAFLYTLWLWGKKKDRSAAFLAVGYLAQYLPWFFVTRITFIYHYFPSVVFVVLMNVYGLFQWRSRLPRRVFLPLVLAYGGAAAALFLLFYPVLSGQPVEASFVAQYLRWFRSWVLTAK